MEFTRNCLSKFVDSGKDICVYSKQAIKLLKTYSPDTFKDYSSRLYYYWVNAQKPIPLSVIFKLMDRRKVKHISILSFSVSNGNSVTIPKIDVSFCYFLGLLLGDGCLVHSRRGDFKHTYFVQISFATKNDAEFAFQLAFKLFNIKPSIHFTRNCYNLCIYSKPLVMALHLVYEIPIGKKYPFLMVPKLIKNCKKRMYQAFFLKGIFDSDGNIYDYRKGKSVQLRQHSEKFINELLELFRGIGIYFREPYYDKANDSWVLWSSKKQFVDTFINKIIELRL